MEYKTICFYKFSIDLLHHRYVFHLYLWNLKNVLVIGWTKEIFCFVCVCVLRYSRLSVTLWTVAHQAPLSMGFFQARTLAWVVISSSRGSSQPRDWTHMSCFSCTGRQILTSEPPGNQRRLFNKWSSIFANKALTFRLLFFHDHDLFPQDSSKKVLLLSLFSHLVMSDSMPPCGLQYARLPCLLLSLEFARTHVHWVQKGKCVLI